jgi:hypothetical protein
MIGKTPVPGTDIVSKKVIYFPVIFQISVSAIHGVHCGLVQLLVTAEVWEQEWNTFIPVGQTLSANWLCRLHAYLFLRHMNKAMKWTKNVEKDGVILCKGETNFSAFHNLDSWDMKLCCNRVSPYVVPWTDYFYFQGWSDGEVIHWPEMLVTF